MNISPWIDRRKVIPAVVEEKIHSTVCIPQSMRFRQLGHWGLYAVGNGGIGRKQVSKTGEIVAPRVDRQCKSAR
jgi:hypothetical protein